jgi:hypothetical protein
VNGAYPVDFLSPLAVATLMMRSELHDLLLTRGANPRLVTRWSGSEDPFNNGFTPLDMWNDMMHNRKVIEPAHFKARLQATRAVLPAEEMAYGDGILVRAKDMQDQVILPFVVDQLGKMPWYTREMWQEYMYYLLWTVASKSTSDGKLFLGLAKGARQLDLESSMPNGKFLQKRSLLAKLAERNNTTAMEYMLDEWDGDVEYTPDAEHVDGPLLAAVKAGAIEAVRWLLERGANRDVVDEKGRKPLQVAKDLGIQALVLMLGDGAGSSRGGGRKTKRKTAAAGRR